MSKLSENPAGLADYVMELDSVEYTALKRTANPADSERALDALASPSETQGMADVVLELSSEDVDALKRAALDADGRRSEVQTARDVLGVR